LAIGNPMNTDAALFDVLAHVTTDSLATVLLKKGLRNQWIRGLMPLSADVPRTVGRAFTMRFIPVREDVPQAHAKKLPVNREAVEAMPESCVAIADARGELGAATFGDIVVWRMVKRGVAGIITDGAVRDRGGLIASGMPIWTAGITAPPPAARLMLAAWQEPIGCGGVAVYPDDIIVADADGVIVVPAGLAREAAQAGAEQERLDEWQLEQVKRGVKLSELAPMKKD
jgi:regulator of RNase E activity RraA